MTEVNLYRYRDTSVKEDDEDEVSTRISTMSFDSQQPVNQVDRPERKWYKHVYKSSLGKQRFRDQKPYDKKPHDKFEKKPYPDLRNRMTDLRTRMSDVNRRDVQLQKEYMAKLSQMNFPKPTVQKTFVVVVDKNESRQIQLQLKSEK